MIKDFLLVGNSCWGGGYSSVFVIIHSSCYPFPIDTRSIVVDATRSGTLQFPWTIGHLQPSTQL